MLRMIWAMDGKVIGGTDEGAEEAPISGAAPRRFGAPRYDGAPRRYGAPRHHFPGHHFAGEAPPSATHGRCPGHRHAVKRWEREHAAKDEAIERPTSEVKDI